MFRPLAKESSWHVLLLIRKNLPTAMKHWIFHFMLYRISRTLCVCVWCVIWEVALSFSPYILLFYYFTIQFLLLHHLILYSSSALGPCERVSFGFYVCHYKSMPTCINYKPNVILWLTHSSFPCFTVVRLALRRAMHMWNERWGRSVGNIA